MVLLFDLSLRINGFQIKKAKAELRKIGTLSENEYVIFLENKKKEIVNFHLQNNPFYKELAGLKTLENWNDLPVLNKKNLQKPLPERLSNGYSSKNVYINKTSGSSGEPFVFAKDKYSHALLGRRIPIGLLGLLLILIVPIKLVFMEFHWILSAIKKSVSRIFLVIGFGFQFLIYRM